MIDECIARIHNENHRVACYLFHIQQATYLQIADKMECAVHKGTILWSVKELTNFERLLQRRKSMPYKLQKNANGDIVLNVEASGQPEYDYWGANETRC